MSIATLSSPVELWVHYFLAVSWSLLEIVSSSTNAYRILAENHSNLQVKRLLVKPLNSNRFGISANSIYV